MERKTVTNGPAFTHSVLSQQHHLSAKGCLAFTQAYLIDGSGAPPLENASVVIKGQQIIAVGQQVEIPADARVIDVQGKALMPGLIDVHVHLGDTVINSSAHRGERTFGGAAFSHNYRYARETLLKYGVTTVRSLGDYLDDILQLRQDIADGRIIGPRVFTSGPSFQQRGGHPGSTVWHDDPQTLAQAARLPVSPDEARQMTDELAARGVDVIKIIISASHLGKGQDAGWQLPWPVIAAIIDQAHFHRLPVAAHTESVDDALKAVGLGVNQIEHLSLFKGNAAIDEAKTDRLFRMMRDKGVYLDATMIVGSFGFRPIDQVALNTLSFGNQLVGKAWRHGVKISAGTDAGAPELVFGWATHAELYMMVHDQGIPPLEAIKAATLTSAELLGQKATSGSVTPGKLADLLIIDGRPDRNIADLAQIDSVWLGGKPVYHQGELLGFHA